MNLTKQDRRILDALEKLTDDEANLIRQVMEIVLADPAKKALAMELLDKYSVKTPEGRTAFLEALRAA